MLAVILSNSPSSAHVHKCCSSRIQDQDAHPVQSTVDLGHALVSINTLLGPTLLYDDHDVSLVRSCVHRVRGHSPTCRTCQSVIPRRIDLTLHSNGATLNRTCRSSSSSPQTTPRFVLGPNRYPSHMCVCLLTFTMSANRMLPEVSHA